MSVNNRIGLNKEKSKELADHLNKLLANYSVFYQNSRGYHWNIRGEKFFILHEKFEELYTDLFQKIDEIAERILTLGYAPEHRSSSYRDSAQLAESTEVTEARKCVEGILDSFQVLIEMQREILDLSGEIGDEGTNAMMSDYIREQEKLVWMYSAFLG